jgi:hypothetical protein
MSKWVVGVGSMEMKVSSKPRIGSARHQDPSVNLGRTLKMESVDLDSISEVIQRHLRHLPLQKCRAVEVVQDWGIGVE